MKNQTIFRRRPLPRNHNLQQYAQEIHEILQTTGGDMKRFLLLTTILAATAASAYAQLTFSSLDFPGGTKTFARGINNQGTIVGAYRITPPRHALLIEDGNYIPLAPNSVLGGQNFSEAFKINDRGDVVGDYDDGVTHGFVLSEGVLKTLDFPGADETIAFAINNSRVVVGEWDLLDSLGNVLATHGFIWKDGTFSDVNFPGAANTSLIGINEKGDYVGVWNPGIPGIGHAFLYSNGQFTTFDVPDATYTQANDLNDEGQIVGVYVDANNARHGFLKVQDSFATIDYPGAVFTSAWGINSSGQIVGIHIDSVGSSERGFIARR
jgi:uncharacterized membrane protein